MPENSGSGSAIEPAISTSKRPNGVSGEIGDKPRANSHSHLFRNILSPESPLCSPFGPLAQALEPSGAGATCPRQSPMRLQESGTAPSCLVADRPTTRPAPAPPFPQRSSSLAKRSRLPGLRPTVRPAVRSQALPAAGTKHSDGDEPSHRDQLKVRPTQSRSRPTARHMLRRHVSLSKPPNLYRRPNSVN